MSKNEVLFMRNKKNSESSGNDDVWDDKHINAAYERAVKMANAEVAKRLAQATNTGSKTSNNKQQEKPVPSTNKGKTSKSGGQVKWTVGMPCRAVYEGDSLEYEAFIIRIISDNECLVKFLGYNNSEIVHLDSLKPTHGKDAQQQQIEDAVVEGYDGTSSYSQTDVELESERGTSPSSADRTSHKKNKSRKKKRDSHVLLNGFRLPEMPPMPDLSMLRNSPMDIPMMPPPLPLPSSVMDCEDQAVSSMLLSWYMSGYYTGLYQGLKRSKQHRKHKN